VNPLLEKRLFTVVKNEPLATGMFQLTLAPAEGMAVFPFIAGQWVYLYLLNEDGSEWARAAFSIASAPSESTATIQLAIKVYGDYTKRAQTLKEGDRVHIQGPFGVFMVKQGNAPLVFCAGGIGITPFRSMVRELFAMHDARPMTLFVSNSTRDAAAYIDEFRELAKIHPTLRVISIFTRESVPDSESRRLDATMLSAHVADLSGVEYYACGPHPFVDAVRDTLVSLGVDSKTKLHKEFFN